MKLFIDINSFRINYNFYVFDTSNQKDHFATQPISVKFKFYDTGAINVMDYTASPLVLTKRSVSIGSDGKRMFQFLKFFPYEKGKI